MTTFLFKRHVVALSYLIAALACFFELRERDALWGLVVTIGLIGLWLVLAGAGFITSWRKGLAILPGALFTFALAWIVGAIWLTCRYQFCA